MTWENTAPEECAWGAAGLRGFIPEPSPQLSPLYRKPVGLLLILGIWILAGISDLHAADNLTRRRWTVDGVIREALIYAPHSARTNAAPLLFAFHGHGGPMQNTASSFSYQTLWPEAIVVCLQGLNTPGRLTDPQGKKPGWQAAVGDQGDRDLKFFDAVLASLQNDFKVDAKRIYSTNYSNGGGFTCLLWAARGKKNFAFAPSAAAAAKTFHQLNPKPVLLVAGGKDTLVKFGWQQQTMAKLRNLNRCGKGEPWEGEKHYAIYLSKLGAPVVTLIHPGPHTFPAGTATSIVKFFKEHYLR